MSFKELTGIAMSCTEEQYIDTVQRHLISKRHIGLANQSGMYGTKLITCITRTVYEYNLSIRMVQQNTYQFACRISGSTYNSNFYHILFFQFILMSGIICTQRGTCNLDKALSLIRSPTLLHLTILTQLVFNQVILRLHTNGRERERT